MAMICPWCHSDETQAVSDRWTCLHCMGAFGMDGSKWTKPGPRNTGEITPHAES
jgi:hypothetical protein